MRKILTIALVGLLGLSAPAFAQTYNQYPSSGAPNSPGAPNAVGNAQVATDGAYAQEAPEDNTSMLLLGGAVLVGAGVGAYLLLNKKSDTAQLRPLSP